MEPFIIETPTANCGSTDGLFGTDSQVSTRLPRTSPEERTDQVEPFSRQPMSVGIQNDGNHDDRPGNHTLRRFARPDCKTVMIRTPKKLLITDPRPPMRRVPPMTTAAMAESSSPIPPWDPPPPDATR